jgi:hypothetical protein
MPDAAQAQDPATFEVIVVDPSATLSPPVETAKGQICIFLGDGVAATPELCCTPGRSCGGRSSSASAG